MEMPLNLHLCNLLLSDLLWFPKQCIPNLHTPACANIICDKNGGFSVILPNGSEEGMGS